MTSLLALDTLIFTEDPRIIGGLLGYSEFDVKSNFDIVYTNLSKTLRFLSAEVKTAETFSFNSVWFSGSKSIQTLLPLYAYNAPTFLFSQTAFKLFVEDRERKKVFTFPFDDSESTEDHLRPHIVKAMGPTFLQLIMICLISERKGFVSSEEQTFGILNPTPTKIMKMITKKFGNPMLGAFFHKKKAEKANVEPSFLSGYCEDGTPVYTKIRVYSSDEISKIEREIVLLNAGVDQELMIPVAREYVYEMSETHKKLTPTQHNCKHPFDPSTAQYTLFPTRYQYTF